MGFSATDCRRSSIGVLRFTVADTSQPPAKSLPSPEVVANASVRIDITIIVKITSANIASVIPVRNLLLIG